MLKDKHSQKLDLVIEEFNWIWKMMKRLLLKNSVRIKRVDEPHMFEGFPQLKNCGGFEVLQCLPNSRDLSLIDCALSAKVLKARLGGSQSKIYVRPIQKVLSIKPIIKEQLSIRVEFCILCKKEFPVRELRKHIRKCGLVDLAEAADTSSSDSDDFLESVFTRRSSTVTSRQEGSGELQNPDVQLTNDENDAILNISHEDDIELINGIALKEVYSNTAEKPLPIMEVVDETLSVCKSQGYESNPVEILRCLQKKLVCGRSLEVVDEQTCPEGATNYILVDRDEIINTGLLEIEAISNFYLTLEVQFYGEKAEDYGGPRKEFFMIMLRKIKEEFFENGLKEDREKDYVTIGIIFALSMLQNGPLVHFMSEKILDEIFDNDTTPSSPALRGLQNGFRKLGICQVCVALPLFRHLFRPSNVRLTLKKITSLLVPKFENEVYAKYLKYLRVAASGRRGIITLGHVLKFATCIGEEPTLGYELHPSLRFIEVSISFIPSSRTCINALMLPRPTTDKRLPKEDELFKLYDYAFTNAYFGNM